MEHTYFGRYGDNSATKVGEFGYPPLGNTG